MMIQSVLLVIALSADAMVAALAYGTGKIKIPFLSALIIAAVGSGFLALSLFAASFLQRWIPSGVCTAVSFTILLLIGIENMFNSTIKNYLRKKTGNQKIIRFHCGGIRFVLDVFLDETKADADHSKILTAREAFYLAVALSLDSLVSGFGFGLSAQRPFLVVALCLVMGFTAVVTGCRLGRSIAGKMRFDIAWIGGALLILLAILRII